MELLHIRTLGVLGSHDAGPDDLNRTWAAPVSTRHLRVCVRSNIRIHNPHEYRISTDETSASQPTMIIIFAQREQSASNKPSVDSVIVCAAKGGRGGRARK